MVENSKIRITLDELYDSRVDEEIVRKQSIILSQKIEKVKNISKLDNRILIQIGIFILCVLLIALMIIGFRMKHPYQQQPSVKTKIYKADLYPNNKDRFQSQTRLLTVTV